jgi:death-on-curing protein
MKEPIWIDKPEVLIAHSMQLAEHGGSDGIRDETLLDSALAKPRNVFAYADSISLERLATAYAFGIARNHAFRNHAFIDGNKRTALVVSEGFLRVNGVKIVAPPEEKYFTFLHLADGSLSEDELTAWLTQHAAAL